MTFPAKLSASAARRLALGAQGLARPRPAGPFDAGHVRRLVEALGLVQIDSVNVLVRSHYLPLFSRLGPYPSSLLDRLAHGPRRGRAFFEYWGHEASFVPLPHHPLLRWRMERAARGEGIYGGLARFAEQRRPYLDDVLAEIRERGPLGASALSEAGRGSGAWWGWSDGKRALEFLFWAGLVTTAGRRSFERLYDVPERVLPPEVAAAPTPAPEEAQRRLLLLAARAMGVATERDLRDYYRLGVADARVRLAELVEAGALVPVDVEGWAHPAYALPDARVPRRAEAAALLSPFDSLVWERARTERLFGFRYRLEIYTPAERRTHGYYVLPFLLGDRLAARVDLKADRAARRLLVQAAHAEPGSDPRAVAAALAAELRAVAGWLGLERVVVVGRGDLAPALLDHPGAVAEVGPEPPDLGSP